MQLCLAKVNEDLRIGVVSKTNKKTIQVSFTVVGGLKLKLAIPKNRVIFLGDDGQFDCDESLRIYDVRMLDEWNFEHGELEKSWGGRIYPSCPLSANKETWIMHLEYRLAEAKMK